MRVLVVESNPRDVALIRLPLQSAGHEVEHIVPSDPVSYTHLTLPTSDLV